MPKQSQSRGREAWRAKVEAELGAEALAKLEATGASGYQPLYDAGDAKHEGTPGARPFLRGLAGAPSPWRLTARIEPPLDASAKSRIADAVKWGASGIELHCKGKNTVDLPALCSDLDLASVALSLSPHAQIELAQQALELTRKNTGANVELGLDPIAAFVDGDLGADRLEVSIDDAAKLAASTANNPTRPRTFRVSTEALHRRGANRSDELAYAITTGLTYLRASMRHDESPAPLSFSFALGSDLFRSVAQVRAFRGAWAQILSASGLHVAMQIVATTSTRSFTVEDPETNILRGTLSALSGAIAGANSIIVDPFDGKLGTSSSAATRLALNTQHVLEDEAQLARTVDPAGGSWLAQALTEKLGRESWQAAGEIEAQGGIVAAIRAGWPKGVSA